MSAIREVSNINTATARGDAKQQQRRTSQRPALRSSREPLRPSTGSHRTYPPVGSQNSSASEHARPSSASAAMGSVAPPRSQSNVASGWVAPPPPSNHRSSSSESPLADRPHADNPDYCTNIIQDITDMFIQRERQAVHRFNEGTAAHESNTSALYSYYASPHYLQYQPEITEKMRLILLDWLVDVHLKFKLRPETMYLTVNLVDRYLSCVNTKHDPTTFVKRSQVQLVGVSAMLLAAKYEEIWPPEVRECVHVAANTYTREEVITMERNICVAVSFRLTVPTAYPFAMRLLSVLEGEDFLGRGGDAEEMQKRHQELHHVTSFFMEHALLDYKGLQYTPSQIGYASVYLALLTMRIKYFVTSPAVVWSQRLRHYSSAELADFRGCAEVILDFIAYLRTTRFHSVTRKYTSPRFGEVTLMRMPLPRELTDA